MKDILLSAGRRAAVTPDRRSLAGMLIANTKQLPKDRYCPPLVALIKIHAEALVAANAQEHVRQAHQESVPKKKRSRPRRGMALVPITP